MRALTHPLLNALFVMALFALVFNNSMTQAAQEDDEHHTSIERLYASWRNAVEAGSIDSYVNVLHDDISLRPPGGFRYRRKIQLRNVSCSCIRYPPAMKSK